LSPKLVGEVFTKLREVRASGVTVLLVEQNVKAALALADRAAVLVEGCERVVAPCAELLADERMAALYLGRHAGGRMGGPAGGEAGAGAGESANANANASAGTATAADPAAARERV
jgi:branched-chain amino acid transport system ATP-binding protein